MKEALGIVIGRGVLGELVQLKSPEVVTTTLRLAKALFREEFLMREWENGRVSNIVVEEREKEEEHAP